MVPHPAHSSSSFNCITLTLLLLPPIILTLYFYTAFPHTPARTVVHPGLASLLGPTYSPALGNGEWVGGGPGETETVGDRVRAIYGEDFWERRMREFYAGLNLGVEEEVVNENGRGDVEGGYADLPMGRTKYWLLGPVDGQKIVLIHGLSIPSLIWTHIAPSLAHKGYRILLYDLYARGYTSAPTSHSSSSSSHSASASTTTPPHTTALYTTQLALLLQHLGPEWSNGELGVVGVSMGGAVAVAFAVQFPYLVNGRVGLLAPAGIVEANDISRTSRFLSSPLMQLVTSSYPFRMYLRHLARASNDSVGRGDEFSELIRIQSAHLPGYNAALASSIRDGPVRNLAPAYAQLGRLVRKARRRREGEGLEGGDGKDKDKENQKEGQEPIGSIGGRRGWGGDSRVLVVWGSEDGVVPFRCAGRVLALVGGEEGWRGVVRGGGGGRSGGGDRVGEGGGNEGEEEQGEQGEEGEGEKWWKDAHARLVTIEGAGHDLTRSHPEVVVRLLDGVLGG